VGRATECALAEPADQDYVGGRDLTAWPTRIGRLAARAALQASRWAAPHRLLLFTLTVGVVLVSALTAVAAEVYEAVVEVDGVAELDQPALDLAVEARSPDRNAIVTAYTDLGGSVGMPVLATVTAMALALAWRQWTPVVLMAATAAGTLTITLVGKAVVGRVRPPLTSAVQPYEHSSSFPSGHTVNSVALAGIVAYLLVRRLRQSWSRALTITAAGAFAVGMGLSRVYLGHHWLTDVLCAWALGLAWLAIVVTAHRLFLTVRRG